MKTTLNPTAAASRVSNAGGVKTVAAWTDAKLSMGNAKVYYEVSRPSSGKVKGSVVLFHELHTDHTDNVQLRDLLVKKGFAVLNVDAPFSGKSYEKNIGMLKGGNGVTLADDARGYAAAMKAAKLSGPITVYGLAHGGGNALMAISAAGMEKQVKKVVLGAPFPHDLYWTNTNDLYEAAATPVRGLVNGLSALMPGFGMFAQLGLGAYEAVAKPLITDVAGTTMKPVAEMWESGMFRKFFKERFPASEVERRTEIAVARTLPENAKDLNGNDYDAVDWINKLNKDTKIVLAVGADDEFLRKFPALRDHLKPMVDAARARVGESNLEYLPNIPNLAHDITRLRPDLPVKWITKPLQPRDSSYVYGMGANP